jgi:drug/metabolite transporter (DMT)-like permease
LQYKGIAYILLSSAAYAVVNFCVKFLDDIPTHEIVFFRSLVSLVLCLIWIKQLGLSFFGNNKKWLIIRGFSGMTALFLFFLTIKHMPLASATTIQYISPIFTVLLATQLMKEKVKPIQWVLFAVAFAGVFMIKGFDERVSYLYLGIGVTSALISGIAYNAIMKCRVTDHPVVVVLYFPLIATPIMGTACLTVEWVTPHGIQWLLLLIMGIFTQIAQVYMTKALHADHSSRIMPFKYFGVIYAIAIGYFFFGEQLPWWSFGGILLVLLGVILNAFVKNLNQKLPPTQGVV